MGKNKRWKRKAKRMMGVSDLFCCDCSFCGLYEDTRKGKKCYGACRGHIRQIEKDIRAMNNLSKLGKMIKRSNE